MIEPGQIGERWVSLANGIGWDECVFQLKWQYIKMKCIKTI
jgi:hypothetical protein